MKKRNLILLLMSITISAYATNKFELQQVFYPIYSNGELVPEDDLPVLSYNDRTYVPLRKLSEASGLDVNFDNKTESIYINNGLLYEAQINALIADIYHDIIVLFEKFVCYDNVLNTIDDGRINNFDTKNSFEIAKNYLEKYLLADIQLLENKIDYLSKIYEYDKEHFVDNKLVDDLYERLEYAKTAYNYAKKCYDMLCDYDKFNIDYFLGSYYGYNEDGYRHRLLEAYYKMSDLAENNYNYYINLVTFYNAEN